MKPEPRNGEGDLAARVADIEKCIGDIAQVLSALKDAVNEGPTPDCPPYCSHLSKLEYTDDAKIEDRVADICKYIGDTGEVFGAMRRALNGTTSPECPPYCAHKKEKEPEK